MLGGRLGASMLDDLLALGRSSCIGTTFLDLDDTMDKLNIVQFLAHHQYIYNPSTGGKNDKGSLKIFKLIKITLKIYIYFFFFKNNEGLLLSPHVTLPLCADLDPLHFYFKWRVSS